MTNIAIILATGRGVRAGGDLPKQYQKIGDYPVLSYSIAHMVEHAQIDHVQIVIHPDDMDLYLNAIAHLDQSKILDPIHGGKERQDSVLNGLRAISVQQPKKVAIHDGARPLIPNGLVDDLLSATNELKGAIAAKKITDTIKKIANKDDEIIAETYDRDLLMAAQTPQMFQFDEILKAHEKVANMNEVNFTDDASIFEHLNIPTKLVFHQEDNLKITNPIDFALAEFYLNQKDKL